MSLQHRIEHRSGYSLVWLRGDPSLGQFLSFIELIGAETSSWQVRRGLFDLREISTLKSVTDHVAIGQAVVRHLAHMDRIASLVPPDRATGISRKEAQGAGVNLAVFVDELAALEWLVAPD
jgi:hypothetical protein